MIVVSATFYPNLQDIRCVMGIRACESAVQLGIRLLLVDASPPEVRAALEHAGATVKPQTAVGKKGAALRQAIKFAMEELPQHGVICFQELEKVEMISMQSAVAAAIVREGADICVPRRDDALFRSSYPIEQYHSEHFANLYLDSLAAAVGFPSIDWTFGPVAFRASFGSHWLQSEGELWDAQIVPMVLAARWHGAHVVSETVEYTHPIEMKSEEEGGAKWSEKRLDQLNFLFKHVGGALKSTQPL